LKGRLLEVLLFVVYIAAFAAIVTRTRGFVAKFVGFVMIIGLMILLYILYKRGPDHFFEVLLPGRLM
jgi:hypothetical protein